jgi:hypothetical protein
VEPGSHLLTLSAEPWGGFQLRNVHKTNVSWSSYPFLPPTTTNGLLASVAIGERWMEGDYHPPRSLVALEDFPGLVSIGGYPAGGWLSRPHFRAHVGTTDMSYDGPLWAPPAGVQSAGKKPAMVEEYFCERLTFFVVGRKECLERLWERVLGRVSPFAKKSVLQFPYESTPNISALSAATATATTEALGALPMIELGSMPKQAHPYLMPVRSKAQRKRSGGYEVTWSHVNCVWESGLMVREGTHVLLTEDGTGISRSLLDRILEDQ